MLLHKGTGSSNKAVTMVAWPNFQILIIFFHRGLLYDPHVLCANFKELRGIENSSFK